MVVLSRLVYRKGIDLLVAIIPRICQTFPMVKFLIAGDGPKKVDLEQVREEHFLNDRVELTGPVASENVRDVLVRGQIFINTSLTEAFCMAIVEAACCGLLVVSTKVGGVPEVLPEEMLMMSLPDEDHLTETLSRAIETIRDSKLDTSKFHEQVSNMYSWSDIAARTEAVYLKSYPLPIIDCDDSQTEPLLNRPSPPLLDNDQNWNILLRRLSEYYGCGELLGKLACYLVIFNYILLMILERLMPACDIDIAPDFDVEKYEGIKREKESLAIDQLH